MVFYGLRGPLCRVLTVCLFVTALLGCQVLVRTGGGLSASAAFSEQVDDALSAPAGPEPPIGFAGWKTAASLGLPKTTLLTPRHPAPPAFYSRTTAVSLPIRC